jgi:Zn-dependent protease with chaperone function
MLNALRKLDSISSTLAPVKSDEYSIAKINSKSKVSLLPSHPPINQRINALEKL